MILNVQRLLPGIGWNAVLVLLHSQVFSTRTRATIEVHHFLSEVPQFGSLRPLPKTLFGEKKNSYTPDETPHAMA